MKQFKNTDYSVTKSGEVFSHKTNKFLKLQKNNGYLGVNLYIDGKKVYRLAHRLVAECYFGDYSEDLQVNHISLNKLDNHISNLEMVNCKENISHYKKSIGEEPYIIKATKNGVSKVFQTCKEASEFLGYKSRMSAYLLACGCTTNRNGYTAERIYI